MELRMRYAAFAPYVPISEVIIIEVQISVFLELLPYWVYFC